MSLERFDREIELLPPSLESAAQELRASLERQVNEIVQAAEAKAAEIEADALREVKEIGRDSPQVAERILTSTIERTDQMLAALDAAERRLDATLGSLRTDVDSLRLEAETLLANLRGTGPVEPARSPDTDLRSRLAARSAHHTQVLDIIREQLQRMYLDETPRSEAEHFVTNFAQGDEYKHLVDEVYSAPREDRGEHGKARVLRRFRRPGKPHT